MRLTKSARVRPDALPHPTAQQQTPRPVEPDRARTGRSEMMRKSRARPHTMTTIPGMMKQSPVVVILTPVRRHCKSPHRCAQTPTNTKVKPIIQNTRMTIVQSHSVPLFAISCGGISWPLGLVAIAIMAQAPTIAPAHHTAAVALV